MADKFILNEDFDIPGADEAADVLGYDPDAEPTLEDQGWEYVASKDIYDEDGFRDSYMWYRKDDNNRFFFSSDADYGDPEYFDWETEGDEAAQEWFDSYGEDEGEEPSVDLDEAKKGEDMNESLSFDQVQEIKKYCSQYDSRCGVVDRNSGDFYMTTPYGMVKQNYFELKKEHPERFENTTIDEAVEDKVTEKAEIDTPRGDFCVYKGTWKDFENESDRDDWGFWFDHYTDDNKHFKIMHNHIDNSAIAVLKEGLNESKRGFVEKYRGYSIHDAGDRYVITDEKGLNVGETRFGIPVCRGMIDDMIDGKEADKITEAKRTKFPRGFNLGSSNNQNVKVRNPYNYTIQELSINNKAKTFERGNFSMGRADIELKNRQEYEDIVDLLKDQGYTEVKSDYHSLRNKTRKGIREGVLMSDKVDKETARKEYESGKPIYIGYNDGRREAMRFNPATGETFDEVVDHMFNGEKDLFFLVDHRPLTKDHLLDRIKERRKTVEEDKVDKQGSDNLKFIGNAKVVDISDLPRIGDSLNGGTVVSVNRKPNQEGYRIYEVGVAEDPDHEFTTSDDSDGGLDGVNTAHWTFAVKPSLKEDTNEEENHAFKFNIGDDAFILLYSFDSGKKGAYNKVKITNRWVDKEDNTNQYSYNSAYGSVDSCPEEFLLNHKEISDEIEKGSIYLHPKHGLVKDTPMKEDTIKTKSGKWTNKGKEGTHGKFNTKKEADAQRKAMFSQGFTEDLDSNSVVGKDYSEIKKKLYRNGYREDKKNFFVEGGKAVYTWWNGKKDFINVFVEDGIIVQVSGKLNLKESFEGEKGTTNNSVANRLITAINDEWKTIDLYNSIISELSMIDGDDYKKMITVIEDIVNEENVHVGQLQKALELISPDTADIAKGEKEAEGQIGGGDPSDDKKALVNEDDDIEGTEWYSTDIKEIPYGKNNKRIKNRKLVDIDKEPVRNPVNEGLEDSNENATLIRTALASGSLDRDAFIDYVLANTPDEMLSGAVNFIGTSNLDTEDDLDFLGDGVDVTDSFVDDLFIDEDTLEDGSVITLKDYSKGDASTLQDGDNSTITTAQNDSEPACDDCDDLPDGVDITLVDVDDDKPLEEEKPLQEMGPLAATLLTAVAPVVADKVMDKVLPEEKEEENKVDCEVHGNAEDDDVDIKGI